MGGAGYKVASDGKTLVSSDGLRVYRPPSFKPRLGKWQANFGSEVRTGEVDVAESGPGEVSAAEDRAGHLELGHVCGIMLRRCRQHPNQQYSLEDTL